MMDLPKRHGRTADNPRAITCTDGDISSGRAASARRKDRVRRARYAEYWICAPTISTAWSPYARREWEFYWERAPRTVRPSIEGPGRPAACISSTRNLERPPGPGGGRSAATATPRYRLLVLAGGPAGIRTLKIPVRATSYSLYVDGRLVASNGTVSSSARTTRPRYNPTTVSSSLRERRSSSYCISPITAPTRAARGTRSFWAQNNR
jgi:hypothetical protein